MKTKVDIISGFLGAGKTTLIKKLLEEKLYCEKLVIIENEFGEIGIDGNILKNTGIEVKEINSGCICCTLVGDLEKAIVEVITKYKPDRIIIEPSGVGKLSDVIKACDTLKLKELITINILITVVDVLKYNIYISNFGEFFENQIKSAKTIILSRSQKIENKKLEDVANAIRKLNANANIITTSWENLNVELIIAVSEQQNPSSLEQQLKETERYSHPEGCKYGCNENHSHSHNADDVFEVWGVETPKIFDENDLNDILKSMSNEKMYGLILRAKGILQLNLNKWVQFDYVPNESEINSIDADYTGKLCIIGKDLKKNELCNLFHITD